jgi:hypothetical protein
VKGCFGFLLFSTKETFFLKEKKLYFVKAGKLKLMEGNLDPYTLPKLRD